MLERRRDVDVGRPLRGSLLGGVLGTRSLPPLPPKRPAAAAYARANSFPNNTSLSPCPPTPAPRASPPASSIAATLPAAPRLPPLPSPPREKPLQERPSTGRHTFHESQLVHHQLSEGALQLRAALLPSAVEQVREQLLSIPRPVHAVVVLRHA